MKFAKPRDKAHELKRQSGSGQKLRVYLPTAPRTSGPGPHQKPTGMGMGAAKVSSRAEWSEIFYTTNKQT